MSLSIAGNIAYSALSAAQVQINLVSANIANADTDGYTVKTATQVSTVSGGVGTGTAITAISSNVDRWVFASLVSADSDLAAATTTGDYTDRLQNLLGSTSGSTDGGTSIATTLSSLTTAVSTLASTPDSDSAKAAVVSALDDTAGRLRSLSSSIQSLRADADQEIATDVDTVNDNLATIDELNDRIVAAKAAGQTTADLEDQRNTALQTIAGLIDVKATTTSTGAMYINTTSGTSLLNSSVHQLSYTPSGTVTAATSFQAITVDGRDITDDIASGSIGALVTLRDETLPDAQDEIDTLAASLIDAVNSATADGSAVPAPTTLEGSADVASTDALSATGSVRIALVDSDGKLVSSTDLDLSSYTTVGDLVDALDSLGGVDASITSDGHLSLTSTTTGDGIAIGALDGTIGSADQSFSSYFGLNSVVTGTGAADIRVSSALLADTSILPTGTLSTGTAATTGTTVLTDGSSTVADALLAAMSDDHTFAASGRMGAQSGSFTDYAAGFVAAVADVAADAQTDLTTQQTIQSSLADTISGESGVNVDEETAKLSQYQTLYSAAAQVMQTVNDMFTTLLDVVDSAS